MTDQPLTYASLPNASKRWMFTAAWISLLVIGALYLLAALGIAAFMALVGIAVLAFGKSVPGTIVVAAIAIVMLAVPIGFGAIYIRLTVKIRRLSLPAVASARVFTMINAILMGSAALLLIVLLILTIMKDWDVDPRGVLMAIFLNGIASFFSLVVAIWLTIILRLNKPA